MTRPDLDAARKEAEEALAKWDARWEDAALQETLTRDPAEAVDVVRERVERCVDALRSLLAVARAAVDVARAAVEMVEAENDFRAFYGFTGADTARVIERRFAAFAALDAAVRGEKGGEK